CGNVARGVLHRGGPAPGGASRGGSSGDRLAGRRVEKVRVIEIERDRKLRALRSAGGAVEGGDEAVRARPQIDHRLSAHRLYDLDGGRDRVRGLRGDGPWQRSVVDVCRADAEDDLAA